MDDFPEAVVLEDQEAGASSINIRYYESELKILEPGPVFSLAEHIKTGYQLKIYNGFLEEPPVKGAPNTCWEYTDYQITLRPFAGGPGMPAPENITFRIWMPC